MSRNDIVTDDAEVVRIAEAVQSAGELFFDLEFVSEDRYVPELALVQVGWGAGEPEVAAIDPLEVDLSPVLALLGRDDILTVAHGARQDIALLAARCDARVAGFADTQLAAAFAGIAEQIGYGKLVARLLGVSLDKKSQFTDWLRRPLRDTQVDYALDDVRYLPKVWRKLRGMLEETGRLPWLLEESARLAVDAAMPRDPATAYTNVGGWGKLTGKSLGALRALAAWRETLALDTNTPPSWIIPDGAMIELCRRGAKRESDLQRARGVGPGTVRKHGEAILEVMAAGAADPLAAEPAPEPLEAREQAWAQIATAVVQGRAAAMGMAVRAVGNRADAEALVRWFARGDDEVPADLALLHGWRRESVGDPLLEWLEGRRAVVTVPDGIDLVELE